MSQTESKPNYKKTLNLPKTGFPMKANLVQNEAASIKRWNMAGVYQRQREQEAGKSRGRFVFHDGPPYANGSIHLGHLMNKCLKDFVVRTRQMMGYDCPFVPGWDCHGLPIEHKVMTELVESGKIEKLMGLDDDTRQLAIRRECQKYAAKYHKLQTGQMERLLTLADYGDPYLTMHPSYEGAVLEVLASLLEQGLAYRALKAVHWSIENETALAEAELEYQDREDISVYVDFEAADAGAVYDAFGLDGDARPEQTPSLMIWTTTPWTLPANMAVAVHERFEYALMRVDGAVTVLASALVERVTTGADEVEVLATAPGSALLGLRYKSPLRDELPAFDESQAGVGTDKVWTVVAADYVTLEDGTGLVHTATGHGTEDYMTGVREGIPVYCPVLADGTYDDTAPEWLRGMSVWEANEKVTERLRESGHLFRDHRFTHSYPHDWRSKTPVIFRATEQWFIGVELSTRHGGTLRDTALGVTEDAVRFIPEWGRNRMRGMLESRPDWCISRQRSWGLPIPAFFDGDGNTLMTAASVRAVAEVVREQGSDAWFMLDAVQLLAGYDAAADPDFKGDRLDTSRLAKSRDILDVWFESGSSWNAVMRERSGGADFPVELYLEGSDQHRGWFQLSLLPALGMMGTPPFKALLTHGFMVDKDGHKLSKSKGHTIEEMFTEFGADVLRWWVLGLSYENDVKVDDEFFRLAGESYRKVRNTLRFMLSNLGDFRAEGDDACTCGCRCVPLDEIPPTSIDAWALGEFDRVAGAVVAAYERYDFQAAHKALYNFCNDTLSSVYLAAVKDRLYCDRPDSERRRRTQTVLWNLTDGLCRLLAPVMCHTADEAFRELHGGEDACVHLEEFAGSLGVTPDEGWAAVMSVRDAVQLALEQAKGRAIENPLDAGVIVPDPDGVLARFDATDLADLCGVSRFALGGEAVVVQDLRDKPRCERSWKREESVKTRSDGGMLSDRDADALGVEGEET